MRGRIVSAENERCLTPMRPRAVKGKNVARGRLPTTHMLRSEGDVPT